MTGFKAGVLGHPIEHSLSPALHRAGYAELSLDGDYQGYDVTENQLESFLSGCDQSWVGLSLTMPLKQRILSLVTHRDDIVDLTQAANTVYRIPSGEWALTNTDVFGIQKALESAGVTRVGVASLIGSGATARSALVALARMGSSSIHVIARNDNAFGELQRLGDILAVRVTRSNQLVPGSELVFSSLPATAQSEFMENHRNSRDQSLAWNTDQLSQCALFDVAYQPWPSLLAGTWSGRPVISGLEMLLWQATVQFTLFTGQPAPVESMRAALPSL